MASRHECERDRGRGLFLLLAEQSLFRNDQMHAGAVHRGYASNSARQLTLERPPVVQLLHKICHAPQRAIAEDLIAHPAPLRETLRGEA